MDSYFVYTCKEGHITLADDRPAACNECGSTIVERVHGVMVSKEEEDELSRKSRHNNFEEQVLSARSERDRRLESLSKGETVYSTRNKK